MCSSMQAYGKEFAGQQRYMSIPRRHEALDDMLLFFANQKWLRLPKLLVQVPLAAPITASIPTLTNAFL